MLPIEQIISWPRSVSETFVAPLAQESSLLTKITLCVYNIFPILAVLVTVIVSIVAFILGGLFNLSYALLVQPFIEPFKPLLYNFLPYAPFPIDMDSPDASSVLRKMSLSPKITSKTLPFIFSRASGPLGIKVTKTKMWPPFKDGSRVNDFGEKFFEGIVTIPQSDTNFWNFVRQGGTELGFSYLESNNNLVQVAAPTSFISSNPKPRAPQLSRELVYRIQTDPVMASKYLLSIFTYLRFFGIELDGSGTWQRTADFEARAANVRADVHDRLTYNQLRMARILHSLTTCGFPEFAEELYQFIKLNYKEFGFRRQSHRHRRSQDYVGGRLARIHGVMNDLAYVLPTIDWFSPVGGNYLNRFPSSDTITQFDNPPRWMSKEKVFQGDDALITQDPDTGRWELPHLEAPPFFCTREEQENFKASPPAKAFLCFQEIFHKKRQNIWS